MAPLGGDAGSDGVLAGVFARLQRGEHRLITGTVCHPVGVHHVLRSARLVGALQVRRQEEMHGEIFRDFLKIFQHPFPKHFAKL